MEPVLSDELAGIRFLKGNSLGELVRLKIEAMIVAGRFAPNERINEQALATACGVSRAPVREACFALAAIGLLEHIPNRGLFLRQMDERELFEADVARGFAFGAVAYSAAEAMSETEIHALRGQVHAMEPVVEAGNVSAYYPLNLAFHQRLCASCGNRRLASAYLDLARALHVQRFRGLSAPESLSHSHREHGAILTAIAARDPRAAFEAARGHVMQGYARILEQRWGLGLKLKEVEPQSTAES